MHTGKILRLSLEEIYGNIHGNMPITLEKKRRYHRLSPGHWEVAVMLCPCDRGKITPADGGISSPFTKTTDY